MQDSGRRGIAVCSDREHTHMDEEYQPAKEDGSGFAKREDSHCGLLGDQTAMAGKATPFSVIVLSLNRS